MFMNITSLRPLTAARAARRLFANPDETEHVFKIIEALQGPSLFRVKERLERTERGRALLATKPDILPLLCDRAALARLPDGSLGRAYLAFVESEGITADGLVEASRRGRSQVTPELMWIKDWLRDTHDLWHVVLGYQGDLVGEAALLAFSHENTGNLGVAMIAALAWFKLGRVTDPSVRARNAVLEGRRMAKRAAWLIGNPWHQWLARSLEDVRRELGVDRVAHYQPVRASEVDFSLAMMR